MSFYSEPLETALTALCHLQNWLSSGSRGELCDDRLTAALNKHSEEPLVQYVMSLYAYHLGNYEGAAFAAATALLDQPDFILARKTFRMAIARMETKRDPQEYLADVALGQDALIKRYWAAAGGHFKNGDMAMADHFIQRANGLKHLIRKPAAFFEQALAKTKEHLNTNRYAEELDVWEQRKAERFDSGRYKNMSELHYKWLNSPNKKQIARCVVDALKESSISCPICVELGASMGALLHLIEQEAAKAKIDARLVGIEQDRQPIEYAKQNLPHLIIHQGNHQTLLSNNIPLPTRISVLLLSFVCEINRPEMVEHTIRFASERCERVIIAADLCNLDGEVSVIREPYLLHPYRKILESNGFRIEHLEMLEEPTPAATGILVAKKT